MLCLQLLQERFRNLVVGGIFPAYHWLSLVKIVPNPMCEGYYTSRFANADADELAFLIVSLTETVNLKAAYSIGQRWDDNRLGLPRLGLPLGLRLH